MSYTIATPNLARSCFINPNDTSSLVVYKVWKKFAERKFLQRRAVFEKLERWRRRELKCHIMRSLRFVPWLGGPRFRLSCFSYAKRVKEVWYNPWRERAYQKIRCVRNRCWNKKKVACMGMVWYIIAKCKSYDVNFNSILYWSLLN